MGPGFPIVLRVEGRRCLVIGTGPEADAKARALTIEKALVDRLSDYRPKSLAGYFLVVSAGPDRTRNAEIYSEAEQNGALLNCLDDPAHCHFTFPSVHRQGNLQIATSTGGACPALAVRLREQFERSFGPEYAEFLDMMAEARSRIAESFPDFVQRREIWYRLVDSGVLDALRRGDRQTANQLVESILAQDALL